MYNNQNFGNQQLPETQNNGFRPQVRISHLPIDSPLTSLHSQIYQPKVCINQKSAISNSLSELCGSEDDSRFQQHFEPFEQPQQVQPQQQYQNSYVVQQPYSQQQQHQQYNFHHSMPVLPVRHDSRPPKSKSDPRHPSRMIYRTPSDRSIGERSVASVHSHNSNISNSSNSRNSLGSAGAWDPTFYSPNTVTVNSSPALINNNISTGCIIKDYNAHFNAQQQRELEQQKAKAASPVPVVLTQATRSHDIFRSPEPVTPLALTGLMYQVQFKHMFRYCTYKEAAEVCEIGSFVLVECEKRGIDLGIVTNIFSSEAFYKQREIEGLSADAEENNIYNIRRLANTVEKAHLSVKHKSEEVLYNTAVHIVNVLYHIPMNIVGTDYQFDGQKLTVFYTSDVRVDYRELIRDLFAKFHTRMWMKKINQCKEFKPYNFATLNLATGIQHY